VSLWNSIESLRSLSAGLMWAAALLAVAAAGTTWFRYYVDQRVGELSAQAQGLRDEESRRRQDVAETALQTLHAREEEGRIRQEVAEQELTNLRARVGSRHVKDRSALVEALRRVPGGAVKVLASTLDPEAKAYAEELVALLEAKWSVEFPDRTIPVNAPPGVSIVVSAFGEPPPHAGPLQHALRSMGVDVKGLADTEAQLGTVTLIVGQKQ